MLWNQHFFASTRGRIVLLLRRASHTVDELAHDLDLTDNAVRAHLATLERDALVRPGGTRRGGGKPAVVYNLTPEAEQLFPKAYAPVLQQLLEVLSTCLSAEKITEIMESTGQRLAAQWSIAPGKLSARLQQAVAILNELGGLAELREGDETYVIQGYSCPFAVIVPGHPEVCQLTQTLLAELIGEPVEEHCEREGTVRCCFRIVKG
ncbi:MAG TPA: ArsR family transcriptional regulator [Ktedonobacteraceae bacterium]